MAFPPCDSARPNGSKTSLRLRVQVLQPELFSSSDSLCSTAKRRVINDYTEHAFKFKSSAFEAKGKIRGNQSRGPLVSCRCVPKPSKYLQRGQLSATSNTIILPNSLFSPNWPYHSASSGARNYTVLREGFKTTWRVLRMPSPSLSQQCCWG